VIHVSKGKSPDTIVLEPQKANFSGLSELTFLKAVFAEDRVRYLLSEPEDYVADLSTAQQIVLELSRHSEGRTPVELAGDLRINEKTVRNHLTGLKKRGRAERMGDGRWKAIPDVPNAIAPGIRESRDASNLKDQEHVEALQAIAA